MISVIIPTYNEGKSIAKCINTILPQLAQDDEVIVVSSGSTDNTIDEVTKIEDLRVRLIVQKERKGKASAINLAVRKARGDIIVQTDGDVELDEDAVYRLTWPLKDDSIVAVSGRPVPLIDEDSAFYDWTHMSYTRIHENRLKEVQEEKFWHLSGYLLAFKKSAFEELPFLKGAVDAMMGLKLKEKGTLAYAPDAIVYVKAPTNTSDFIAQKARVRAGFLNLPNAPRTAGSEIKEFPKELLKIKISRWPQFIYCGFVYAYSWWKGGRIKNKDLNEIWKEVKSSK